MKKWYLSKTFWVNVIALISVPVRAEYGLMLTPEGEVMLLGLINLALRKLTKEEIVW